MEYNWNLHSSFLVLIYMKTEFFYKLNIRDVLKWNQNLNFKNFEEIQI